MRKKIFLVLLFGLLFTGCFNKTNKNIVESMKKEIESLNTYHITGELEIINNEDSFQYDVDVSFQKEDQFRVSLKNKTNNHEQIILKNDEGVFVKTQESTKQKLNVI